MIARLFARFGPIAGPFFSAEPANEVIDGSLIHFFHEAHLRLLAEAAEQFQGSPITIDRADRVLPDSLTVVEELGD